MWSFGVLLYNLISSDKAPFIPHSEATIEEVFEYTCEKEVSFDAPEWLDKSQEMIDLIKLMLNKDPEMRINIEAVVNHPWFSTASNW